MRDSTKFLNGMVSSADRFFDFAGVFKLRTFPPFRLSRQNDSFSETQGFLGGTFRRMNAMAARQGGRWWYCECVLAASSPSAYSISLATQR